MEEKRIYALILAPTRELALQVNQHLKNICQNTTIKIATLVGGLSTQKQERLLKNSPQILVATPGRLWELIQKDRDFHNFDNSLCDISKIDFLVVDEADRMIQNGAYAELTNIFALLPTCENSKRKRQAMKADKPIIPILKNKLKQIEEEKGTRQTFIFSATLQTEHTSSQMKLLMKKIDFQRTIKKVDLTTEDLVAEAVQESKIECLHDQKVLEHFSSLKS